MKYLFLLVGVLIVVIAAEYYLTRQRINVGIDLAKSAVPFEREGTGLRILIIGDSTVVGTGASSGEQSIAGLVGKTFPEATIVNKGLNGAKVNDLIDRLKLTEDHFDLVMVHIGGNDIIRFTDYGQLSLGIDEVLELAKQKADNVTLTTTGNMGTARLLPFGSRWIFEQRTRKVREIFKTTAEEKGLIYNDLFREKPFDPFAQDPKKHYAADSFHPSDAGYADWYTIIEPGVQAAIQ